jgi:hypothetical protein
MAKKALYHTSTHLTEPNVVDDNVQMQLMYAYENILNMLNTNSEYKDNLNAAFYYIYKAMCRNAINIARIDMQPKNDKKIHRTVDHRYLDTKKNSNEDFSFDNYYNKDNFFLVMNIDHSPTDAERIDMRIEIDQLIDKKIKKMRYINRPSVVFLLHLQRYLKDNDYDVRGFRTYVCECMNLNIHSYSAILTKLGMEGTELRTPIITKENKQINDAYTK